MYRSFTTSATFLAITLLVTYTEPAQATENTFATLFETFEGSPAGWTRQSWRNNQNAQAFVSSTAKFGNSAAQIHSSVGDDAMLWKEVAVKPNTDYELSGYVKTQNVVVTEQGGSIGANLSLWGTREASTSITGTQDWTLVKMRFNSANRTSVKIAVRLGHRGSTAKGTAWFDEVCLIEDGTASVPTPSVTELPEVKLRGNQQESQSTVKYPIVAKAKRFGIGSGGHVRSAVKLYKNGHLTVTTEVWTKSFFEGTSGSTVVALIDAEGNLLWKGMSPRIGVNGEGVPGDKSRKEKEWDTKVGADIALKTRYIYRKGVHNPKGWLNALKGTLSTADSALEALKGSNLVKAAVLTTAGGG